MLQEVVAPLLVDQNVLATDGTDILKEFSRGKRNAFDEDRLNNMYSLSFRVLAIMNAPLSSGNDVGSVIPSVHVYQESVATLVAATAPTKGALKYCPYMPLRRVLDGLKRRGLGKKNSNDISGISAPEIDATDVWEQAMLIVERVASAAYNQAKQKQGAEHCSADQTAGEGAPEDFQMDQQHGREGRGQSTCSNMCVGFDMILDSRGKVWLQQVRPRWGLPNMRQCADEQECQYDKIWLPHPQRNLYGARIDTNAPCEQLEGTDVLDPEPLFRSAIEQMSTGNSSSWKKVKIR
jgi:hypothetical protein